MCRWRRRKEKRNWNIYSRNFHLEKQEIECEKNYRFCFELSQLVFFSSSFFISHFFQRQLNFFFNFLFIIVLEDQFSFEIGNKSKHFPLNFSLRNEQRNAIFHRMSARIFSWRFFQVWFFFSTNEQYLSLVFEWIIFLSHFHKFSLRFNDLNQWFCFPHFLHHLKNFCFTCNLITLTAACVDTLFFH